MFRTLFACLVTGLFLLSLSPSLVQAQTSEPSPTGFARYYIRPVNIDPTTNEGLRSVSVFIDGQDTTRDVGYKNGLELFFCDGCSCFNVVACSLGEHTVKLVKTGYLDWQETNSLFAGYTKEVSPQMEPLPTPIPSPTLTLSPTSSPTTTPQPTSSVTPTPTVGRANYKINEPKDSGGNTLSSVKVYVDGNYVHHYAPEELVFCSGCECYSGVPCGFGEHTIRLDKADYLSWSEKKNLTAGSTFTVDPVMTRETEPTSTPSPTSSPLPSFTPSPTRASTLTPTPSDDSGIEANLLGEEATSSVLGWSAGTIVPLSSNDKDRVSRPSIARLVIPVVVIGSGVGLVGFSLFFFFRHQQSL